MIHLSEISINPDAIAYIEWKTAKYIDWKNESLGENDEEDKEEDQFYTVVHFRVPMAGGLLSSEFYQAPERLTFLADSEDALKLMRSLGR